MSAHVIGPEDVAAVSNLESLFSLLRERLDWPLGPAASSDEGAFQWTAAELNISDDAAWRLRDGSVRQLRPLVPNQPWGIFLVEFRDGHVYRTALRQVLRGLVPKKRGRDANLPAWKHENLLFICTTSEYDRFTFGHFRGKQHERARLATFSWQRNDPFVRTLCEYNLPRLQWPEDDGADTEAWLNEWTCAFDKEPLTKVFFSEIANWYFWAVSQVRFPKDAPKEADGHDHVSVIRLITRLIFCWFVKEKGLIPDALFDERKVAQMLDEYRDG